MNKSLLALLLFVSFFAQAQRFQGRIIDQKNAPLEYVNIGVVGKNAGTVSSATGLFTLTLHDSLNAETLLISAIGYAPLKFKVSEFKAIFADKAATIQLKEQAVALKEVVVRPRKMVTKVVGNTTTSKAISAGFKSNSLGAEVGIALKIKKPSFLENVSFNIAGNQYDTLFLRINVYNMTENGPGENMLRDPIYLHLAKKDIGDAITLDLRDRNIYLETDVLLSLELVRDLGKGGLTFSAGLFHQNCYFRQTSQSNWERIPLVGLGFSATVSQEK